MLALRATLILLTTIAAPAFAETITAEARVAQVTLYPQGATVTRRVEITAPAGVHEIILPGMPDGTDPDSLRITATGAKLGSVSLQQGRALPDEAPDTDAMRSAKDDVQRLEKALRNRDAATAAIRAEAQAANDLIAFLLSLAGSDGATSGDVATLAQSVQTQILEARKSAIWAENSAQESEIGRDDDLRALDAAHARLAALQNPQTRGETLVLTVETGATPAQIDITSHSEQAGWRPVYDLRLDREAGTLSLDRGVVVSQATGEDWQDVTLTLSTARPGNQSAPTEVP